jgi:hypothetical protein
MDMNQAKRALAALLVGASLALGSAAAFAADTAADSELRAVQAQLELIQKEQQSIYQEFQMIQELRRLNLQPPAGPAPIGYDDMVRQRAERETRADQYTAEMSRRYERFRELEDRKAPLIERLNQLQRR